MQGIKLFLFIVTLPALIALVFDIYFTLNAGDGKIVFATPGYILTHYSPETLAWMARKAGPAAWPYVNMALGYKSIILGGGFAGFFYIIIGLLKLAGIGPFRLKEIYVPTDRADQLLGRDPRGEFKYKKK